MRHRLRSAETFTMCCGVLVASFGAIDWLDWSIGTGLLVAGSRYTATAPLAALGFLVTGIALVAAVRRHYRTANLLAAALAVLVVLNVCLFAFGAAEWPAQALSFHAGGPEHAVMSWATSLCFSLAALSIRLFHARARRSVAVAAISASIGLIVVVISLLSILFDVGAIYSVPFFVGHALSSALAFLVSFAGLLMLRPARSWTAILLGRGAGSMMARWLFPFTILIPVVLCYAGYRAMAGDVLPDSVVVSIIAALSSFLLGASVLWSGHLVNEREARLAEMMRKMELYARDRDLLLREVNHRVKNNLAQVHAMLGLQARRVADPVARQGLIDMKGRIEALSTLHRILLAKDNPSTLCAQEYFTALCERIEEGLGARQRGIRIAVHSDRVQLQPDFAISTGMLLNELAGNAIKHAFAASGGGTVDVSFRVVEGDRCELSVEDDGSGLQPSAPRCPEDGLGTKIIQAIVAQLRGSMEVSHESGSRFSIRMPVGR
ncbi:sensor histidine kinase [Jiella avicenniae]|uniref:histidine kinase n=1 Tax=Jiella avicenniae TaxID=2907202 RepID=A0A9X1P539_9HYPH|nr:sensor histidine kinase [Jiella avicenniae]MCE7030668.1 sensor histidine kinase [Jiella avicenniae]